MSIITATLAPVKSATFADRGDGWYDIIPSVVPAPARHDLDGPAPVETIDADKPGTDGDYLDEPTGPDDADAEWAAHNLNGGDCHNVGWVEGEFDGSAIELRTISAWDRHLDDLAATSDAMAHMEAGYACC